MKTSNKRFDQCGNAQAVANEQHIIIAADVTDQANDVRQVVAEGDVQPPMQIVLDTPVTPHGIGETTTRDITA